MFYREPVPGFAGDSGQTGAMEEQIVVVGGGFGGYACARRLARAGKSVVLIDKNNHFLFQPLLYQVATAGLSPANIAWPIRGLLARYRSCRVLMAEVTAIDRNRRVVVHSEGETRFDSLVIATGATHAYFGHNEWEQYASGLKTLEDATAMRSRILRAFEEAEATDDDVERESWMTIAIVGGGPTGVEMAGSLAELTRRTLAKEFRQIDPTTARIVLVEARKVLGEFPGVLQEAAVDSLRRLGVEVVLGQSVTGIDADGLRLGDTVLRSKTVVWAAGVKASPAAAWLGVEADSVGRIVVDDHCRVPGWDNVFAIGDVNKFPTSSGKPLPGTCPAAMQQGDYVARLIMGKEERPFVYKDKGILATIGRKSAVAKLGKLEFSGFPAWALWTGLHLWTLLSGQSRVLVFLQWISAYFSYSRGARLITRQ